MSKPVGRYIPGSGGRPGMMIDYERNVATPTYGDPEYRKQFEVPLAPGSQDMAPGQTPKPASAPIDYEAMRSELAALGGMQPYAAAQNLWGQSGRDTRRGLGQDPYGDQIRQMLR